MNQLEMQRFEKIVKIVNDTLSGISDLFEEFGIGGMHKLIDPSLSQLKKLIFDMSDHINNYEKELIKSKDDLNSMTALMFLPNVKQGLLYADSLLVGIEKFDVEYCERAHTDIKGNSLFFPQWVTNDIDEDEDEDTDKDK